MYGSINAHCARDEIDPGAKRRTGNPSCDKESTWRTYLPTYLPIYLSTYLSVNASRIGGRSTCFANSTKALMNIPAAEAMNTKWDALRKASVQWTRPRKESKTLKGAHTRGVIILKRRLSASHSFHVPCILPPAIVVLFALVLHFRMRERYLRIINGN